MNSFVEMKISKLINYFDRLTCVEAAKVLEGGYMSQFMITLALVL
jgi:hypothetical protein